MNKRKKLIGIIAILLVIVIVGILCKSMKKGDREISSSDMTYSFMQESYLPEGMFQFDGDFLRFTDAVTGISSIICDDVSCMHQAKRNSECGALFYGTLGLRGMTIQDGHLIYMTSKGGIGDYAVYRCEFNGKNRKEIAELPYMETIYMVSYYEDIAYIGYVNELASDLENYVEAQTGVYALNLTTGKGKDIFKQEGYQASVSSLFVNEKYISFCCCYVDAEADAILAHKEDENYTKEHLKEAVIVIDKDNGKQILSVDGQCFGAAVIVDEHIMYVKDEITYMHDIKAGEGRSIIDAELSQIPAFGEDFMFMKGYEEETGKCIYYSYLPEKNELIELGKSEFVVEAICGDVVYLYGISGGGISQCGFMEKKDFVKGNYEKARWSEIK